MDEIELLKKLISINSTSGNEKEIEDFIIDYIKTFGYSTKKQKVSKKRYNLILEKGDGERCLILNAHLDTVSTSPSQWKKTDPFKPREINGKIYGLGASDTKAQIALFLKSFIETKERDDLKLILSLVVGEEVDGIGTKIFIQNLKKKKKYYAVIGEPTNLNLVIGHKGSVFLKVFIKGKGGHASMPWISKNPVEKSLKVIKEMKNIEKRLASIKNKFLGKITITPTNIFSARSIEEASINVIPNECVLTFDIRTIPEIEKNNFMLLRKELRKLKEKKECGVKPKIVSALKSSLTPPSHPFIRFSFKILKKVVRNKKILTLPYATDMVFFVEKNIPSFIFGSGNPYTVHRPDEFVEISEIKKASIFLKKLLESF